MDWTDFDAGGQSTLVLSLVTGHGRAAPLIWLTVWKQEIATRRNDYEDACLRRLAETVPPGWPTSPWRLAAIPPSAAWSPPPDLACAQTIAKEHGRIENRLPYVRDVTFREDQCRTRARAAPQVLAAIRNTALTIIRRSGRKPVESFEHFAEHRQQALDAAIGRRTE